MCPGAFSPPNHQPDNTAIGTPSDFLSLVRVPRLMKPEQFRQIERSVGWPRCWRCLLRNPTMAPTCRERNHKKAMENGPFIEDFPIKTSIYIIWLVVWNMAFMTFHILGIIIPTDFHIFRGVETTNQAWCTRGIYWIEHVQSRVLRFHVGSHGDPLADSTRCKGLVRDAVDQGNHNNGTQDSRAVGRILSQPWLWKVCYKLNIGRWWQTDRDSKIMIHKLGQPVILG